jgi:molybdopterin-guanine dinucleotide biosynthesis protein A
MGRELDRRQAKVCSVSDGERIHAACMLVARTVEPMLREFLESGQRRVLDWLAQQQAVFADFSDRPEAFANINRPEDLRRIEETLARNASGPGPQ